MSDPITAYIPVAQLAESPSEGEFVEYDDETYGLIIETHTSDFEFPKNEDGDMVTVEASDDEPVYVVGRQGEGEGTEPMTADDFEVVDRDKIFDEDDPDPTKDLGEVEEEMSSSLDAYDACSNTHEMASLCTALDIPEPTQTAELAPASAVDPTSRTQRGLSPWPESWRESDKPARLIALDAWTSMEMSHTGCVREMRGKVSRPNAFCAAWKDEIYGHPYWREGG